MIVTHLPLQELWRDDGFSTTARDRSLTEEDVRSLLASGPVQIVVVDVGAVSQRDSIERSAPIIVLEKHH